MFGTRLRLALVTATALSALPALADTPAAPVPAATSALEGQFRDPPASARPRVWWHWMNGNISKDGIAKDMAWMKRVGIGGLQNFDANLKTPQVVDKRLVYMTPEWKDAFRFAATEADRQGLELAIAASPGWSETGGPWVPTEDGLKKLVWSETDVVGGKAFAGKLAAPPSVTGPFQTVAKTGPGNALGGGDPARPIPTYYADVAVLAWPVDASPAVFQPKAVAQDGQVLDIAPLTDTDLMSAVSIKKGSGANPASVTLDYGKAQTMRSASLFLPGAAMLFMGADTKPRLEASDDGAAWRTVAEMPAGMVPTTISFSPVTARYFRVLFLPAGASPMSSFFAPAPGVDLSALSFMAAGASGGATGMKIGDLRLSPDARIDRYEAKAGNQIEQDYYALSAGLPEVAGVAPGKVVDLTAKMRADGTLDWTPPKGRWRVLRLGYSLLGTENHPAPPEATGLEVDKFDGAAVRRYLDHYIGMYRDAAGKEMVGAKGVQAILTDSIEVGAANWTPRMVEQFKALRGYDPTPWMPALTGVVIGSRADSDRFLYDYRRTLADLMASQHYGTVAAVAHENGLKVYGEALEDHRPSLGDDMAMRRYTDIPMAAMWTYRKETGPKLSYIADIKGAASVAHIYGQNLVAAESLTSSLSYWRHAPGNLKPVIDLEFVNGVNRPVIHTSVHQPVDDKVPGLSLFMFGQYFNRHESWAEMAKPWVDYISRNSLMLQQGRNVADVAYFYGEEAPLTGLYGDKLVPDAPKTSAYDFINADALSDAISNEGAELVAKGGARYRLLYLGGSSHRMTLATLRRIAALVEGGATVVGKAPEGNPGLAGDAADYAALVKRLWSGAAETVVGKGRVIASNDVEAALRSIGIAPDFRFTGGQADSEIPFLHRKLADGDSYFLVNRKERAETVEARFRVTGKAPELWHAETGTSEPVSYRIENGETIVSLTLAAEQSVHVVFRKAAKAEALAIKALVPVERGRIESAWTVHFQPGRSAPTIPVTMATLAPLNGNKDPAIKYFSGVATYANSFATPAGWKAGQPLWIDLGAVHELAEVWVNGKSAGTVWHAPYRIDIGAVAKAGQNKIEVKVANLWVNRLIGDAQPGAKPVTWTALASYRKDAPLVPSGLVGPVTLLGQ
ncbi:glycoside hydrolase [Sphingobium sufflavum]|uniref:glycosyl hydrolase n=1 Tax=Sphingobium sufflavum TaxID=1129547 RepID=UPI001F1BB274|nr:glycosyl hydrolase [Sphingobium sufflavum]MCE7796344.1 glycoside hydrolase [Sphingobium sufflavum]